MTVLERGKEYIRTANHDVEDNLETWYTNFSDHYQQLFFINLLHVGALVCPCGCVCNPTDSQIRALEQILNVCGVPKTSHTYV